MMCSKPYREGVAEYGCGSCLVCRRRRRRIWVSRLMLEAQMHRSSWFVTLTYGPEHLPVGVEPRHLQLFLKRLREDVYPEKIRFYGVGEYGDVSGRPHYHVLLFGLSDPGRVAKAWGFGHVHVGFVTPESCGYTVGYVCKGMTKSDDKRLDGRHPEFARMSLRPGIGADAMKEVARGAKALGYESVDEDGVISGKFADVPERVRSDMRMWPLGRYLRRRMRGELGMGARERLSVSEARALSLVSELIEPGAREERESKREQDAWRAKVLDEISRSKKGIGV